MRIHALFIAALLGSAPIAAQEEVATRGREVASSQVLDAAALEAQIKATHATAMETTVGIFGRSRRGTPRGSGASGVIVSADGYVLTAAHVIEAMGEKPLVRMPDGSLVDAVSLGRDDGADYGLLQIEGAADLSFAEVGSSSALTPDEVCLMYGHPGGVVEGRPAVLRLGVYLGVRRDGMVRTSCKMMPGDSGGPVFDLGGKVVAINSQIRLGLDHNYHAAVDPAVKNWQRLIDGEEWRTRRRGRPAEPTEPTVSTENGEPPVEAESPKEVHILRGGVDSLRLSFADGALPLRSSIARAEDSTGETIGLCFAVGENRLLAKSSRIHEDDVQLVVAGGAEGGADLRTAGRVIARDSSTDLALIEAQELSLKPAEFFDMVVEPGTLLGTVGDGASILYAGVAGAPARAVPNTDYGMLGVRFDSDEDDGKIEIEVAVEDSPAHTAGLRSGDTLLEFDGTPYTSGDALRSVLRKTKPGQNVTLKILAGDGEEGILKFALGSSAQSGAGSRSTHVAYKTATSLRRDGFPAAQRHDMALELESVASPVIDLQGRVVGLNAARFDRTASLLLPAATVMEAIQRMDSTADGAQ